MTAFAAKLHLTGPSPSLSNDWPTEALEQVDRCPLCGSGNSNVLYRDLKDLVCFCASGNWTLYRCAHCECVYLNPRPTPATIGQAYAKYHTHEETPESASPKGFADHLRGLLRNDYLNSHYKFGLRPALPLGRWIIGVHPPLRGRNDRAARLPLPQRGARLLDIGCGNGAFVKDAITLGWDAEGLDPDPEVAAAVSPQLSARIATGTLAQVSYPDGRFAAVTMDHTIEHLHEPMATLGEVFRILQPGGWVWIATPNVNSIGHGRFKRDWRGLEPPRHLVLFTAEALRAALAATGYEKIRQLRGPFASDWWFTRSYRIACGEDPLADRGTSLPLSAKISAWLADWRSFLIPRRGEELIFVARRPLDS